jgi:hypothetical protein
VLCPFSDSRSPGRYRFMSGCSDGAEVQMMAVCASMLEVCMYQPCPSRRWGAMGAQGLRCPDGYGEAIVCSNQPPECMWGEAGGTNTWDHSGFWKGWRAGLCTPALRCWLPTHFPSSAGRTAGELERGRGTHIPPTENEIIKPIF